MVDEENKDGFEIINAMIKIIEPEKIKPEKFCFMLKIKNFDFLR